MSYVYDSNSNVQTKTDARSIATNYSYDVLNRVLGKTYNDGFTLPVTYAYDTSSVTGASYTVGRLTNATVKNGSVTMAQTSPYSYDRMGRLWSEQQYTPANCGGTAYSRSYTYDLGGGVSSATFGLPSTVTAGLGATEGSFRNLKLINVIFPEMRARVCSMRMSAPPISLYLRSMVKIFKSVQACTET